MGAPDGKVTSGTSDMMSHPCYRRLLPIESPHYGEEDRERLEREWKPPTNCGPGDGE